MGNQIGEPDYFPCLFKPVSCFHSLNIKLVFLKKLNMKGYILSDFIFKIVEVLQ